MNFGNIYCSPKNMAINGSIAQAIPVEPIINIIKLRKFNFLLTSYFLYVFFSVNKSPMLAVADNKN